MKWIKKEKKGIVDVLSRRVREEEWNSRERRSVRKSNGRMKMKIWEGRGRDKISLGWKYERK